MPRYTFLDDSPDIITQNTPPRIIPTTTVPQNTSRTVTQNTPIIPTTLIHHNTPTAINSHSLVPTQSYNPVTTSPDSSINPTPNLHEAQSSIGSHYPTPPSAAQNPLILIPFDISTNPTHTNPNPNPASIHPMVTRTLTHNKARLVANDSTQIEGIDVDETFSPVMKPGTIRTVLSLATYMHQQSGFRVSEYPDYLILSPLLPPSLPLLLSLLAVYAVAAAATAISMVADASAAVAAIVSTTSAAPAAVPSTFAAPSAASNNIAAASPNNKAIVLFIIIRVLHLYLADKPKDHTLTGRVPDQDVASQVVDMPDWDLINARSCDELALIRRIFLAGYGVLVQNLDFLQMSSFKL
ncbi:hypothetical protein Tco_1152980 [Tanacetum coccineum]